MSAHEDIHLALSQIVEHFASPFAFDDTRKQLHAHRHVAEKPLDGVEMLLGKNLRGGHDARLKTIVYGDEHGEQCHQGLARPHVALQQSVHLMTRTHVVSDLVHHPLLCSGKLERQLLGEECVECRTYFPKDTAPVFLPVLRHVSQDIELHEEQFLKLQPHLRPLHVI